MSKTMETPFTAQDKTWIQKTIRETYSKAVKSPDSLLSYSTGYEALKTLNYNPELLLALPSSVAASYCGVGNPFTLGPINGDNQGGKGRLPQKIKRLWKDLLNECK